MKFLIIVEGFFFFPLPFACSQKMVFVKKRMMESVSSEMASDGWGAIIMTFSTNYFAEEAGNSLAGESMTNTGNDMPGSRPCKREGTCRSARKELKIGCTRTISMRIPFLSSRVTAECLAAQSYSPPVHSVQCCRRNTCCMEGTTCARPRTSEWIVRGK